MKMDINTLLRTAFHLPRSQTTQALAQALPYAQVDAKNGSLISEFSQGLTEEVDAAFGGLSLICILTQVARRQVYFAVLAKLQADGKMATIRADETARTELLTRMLTARNDSLVIWAYGSCPPGFLSIVARSGERARKPGYYLHLHAFLREHPALAATLQGTTKGQALSDDAINILKRFPRTLLGVQAGARFDRCADLDRFLRAYEAIIGTNQIQEGHLRRLASGETPAHLVERLYLGIPFPEPFLRSPVVRFVQNGRQLVRVAKENSNCLANYVAEAQSGMIQYYTWTSTSGTTVIFSITQEPPFGWFLSELKRPGNEQVSPETLEELRTILRECGVSRRTSVEGLMSTFHELRGQTDDYVPVPVMPFG
jgi:hypothetical protein